MNLRELQAFRAVMTAGTTIGASEVMHISQPAISRHIANLETYCGFTLFKRENGRLHPTVEAQALLAEITTFHEGLQKIEYFLKNMKSDKSGHVRIVATSPMAHGVLPRIVADFLKTFPDITTSMRIVPRRNISADLEARDFDIGIVTMPIDYPPNNCESLGKARGVAIVPLNHRLANRQAIDVHDFQDELFIASSSESLARQMIDYIFCQANVSCRQLVQTHSALSVCELVAAGAGISLVDPFTASTFFGRGVAILPFQPNFFYEYGLVFPVKSRNSRAADLLATYIRRGFRAGMPASCQGAAKRAEKPGQSRPSRGGGTEVMYDIAKPR